MPRFRTPPETPATQNTRTLAIPNSREWLAVFSDALAETINPYNYTQKDSESLTPEEAALVAYEAYEAWLLASESTGTGDCPDCVIPDSDPPKPIIRRNPDTGRFERLGSGEQFGTWVPFWADENWPTSGDNWPTIPDTHEAAEDPLCEAASNAAEVLKQVFLDVHDAYDNGIGADIAAADTVIFIGAQIGSILALPVAPAIELGYAAWKFFYSLMDGLFTDFWSDVFTENLICILKDNASIDEDGIVHFDYFGVQRQILETIWNSQSYVLLVAQVNYMLMIIGPDGLDAAGALDAVTGDCSSCGEWCAVWTGAEQILETFTLTEGYVTTSDELGWVQYGTAFDGAYKRIRLQLADLDTSQSVITEVGATVYKPAGSTHAYLYQSALPGLDAPTYQSFNYATGSGFMVTSNAIDNVTTSDETDIDIRLTSNAVGQAFVIKAVRIRGTGINPFPEAGVC